MLIFFSFALTGEQELPGRQMPAILSATKRQEVKAVETLMLRKITL
jgi:hypothetical protein